jgi:hypothetical protein
MAVDYTTLRFNDPLFAQLEPALEVEYGLPTGMLYAIRAKGERSNNNQVSSAGAKGVYQFMDTTFKAYASPGASPLDPYEASRAAAKYMRWALDTYQGNVGAALAEYNGGPKAARKYIATGDPGNDETRKYVKAALPFVGQPTAVAANAGRLTPSQSMDSLFGEVPLAPVPNAFTSNQQISSLGDFVDEQLNVNLDVALGEDNGLVLADGDIDSIINKVFNG